jgi:magnesium transporter
MLRILYRDAEGNMQTSTSLETLKFPLEDSNGVVWLDLVAEPPEVCTPILQDMFHFHPLAISDALDESHVPKIDDWDSYLYLVLHAVEPADEPDAPLKTLELDCFLGPNYLVTYQSQPIATVNRFLESLKDNPRALRNGSSRLLYTLTDVLIDDYLQSLDILDDQMDMIEDQLFSKPPDDLLSQLFTLKRTLLRLRRILAPQRELVNKLARGNFTIVPEAECIYFRDVYDHLVRIYDITDSMRDLASGALDSYLSVVNNRMNDVMKTLTIITTLFMPLSFLVGFFGMNFFQPVLEIPGWTGGVAFVFTLAIMVLAPLTMYGWMRKRGWL